MKIFDIVESTYNNWVRYTDESLRADWDEYKLKEEKKWRSRAAQIGAAWPLFDSIERFQKALDVSPIVKIDRLGPVRNLTKNRTIEDIENMVSVYLYPRDVQRIVAGLTGNKAIPLPIILQGQKDRWIMTGNTRQAVARVLGIEPRALLVDVKD